MDKTQMLRTFLRVADAGSITAAANILDCGVTYVSRMVSQLENDLHVQLFDRTARRIRLTDAGERYYQRCVQILADLAYADAEACASQKDLAGTLRVHGTPCLGQTHLAACIVEYQKRFPDVKVNLTLSSMMPRLVEEQFDVSVVTAQTLPDSGYVSQVAASSHSILVASPSYLKRNPLLSDGDLTGHACVKMQSLTTLDDGWLQQSVEGDVMSCDMSVRLKVNDAEALRAALHAGAGIGALPGYFAIDDLRDGTLIRVLPKRRLPLLHIYSVYPSRRYVCARVRSFVDFIKHELSARIDTQEAALYSSVTTSSRSDPDDRHMAAEVGQEESFGSR
ncbi:LysR substrate-binding domain-containing protein [Paraburkholderia sp. JHI869]|uniref:LysR family transcriptional regulator n=1 Tax=Paraburkholderia sp. JHI869 TaxID=3112959 RepID=UPI00316C983F